jgi:hypothetical protein
MAKNRKRLLTRLYESLDQIDNLMVDGAKKPSALKAAVSKAEILAALLKREDEQKARKAQEKAATPDAQAPTIALGSIQAEINKLREGEK